MTARPVQMPLDLSRAPAYSAADFLIADSNRAAVACIENPAGWPGFAHALVGAEGSGKTHLAHLFAARTAAPIVAAAALTADAVPNLAMGRAVVVEDADRGIDEAALLHLFNLLRERERSLLLTARIPPARWAIALADLRSRMAALPVTTIGMPDEALLGALLVKLFADRQMRVARELVAYVLPRIERSFAAVRAAVETLDRAALEQGRPLTVPLAREVLSLGAGPPIPDPPDG